MTDKSEEYVIKLDGKAVITKSLVGGKAWSISEMQRLDIPVPPAFVITTEACRHYLEFGSIPEGVDELISRSISWLEQETERTFSGGTSPLLISVRSGAEVSMPGMMDTILNLGMNQQVEEALAIEQGDATFAQDTHRRFLKLYSEIVLKQSIDWSDEDDPAVLRNCIEENGVTIPESGYDQLNGAVEAVFSSWNSRRAKRYRKANGIPDSLGTAVTIQAMVFGNVDEHSGTGVLFSRNPITGEREPYGEYMVCAQGEDVVAGSITPEPIAILAKSNPRVYKSLLSSAETLEAKNKEVQDIEFTIERGKLFLLQTRNAKRAPLAALHFAVDFVKEGVLEKLDALSRISVEQLRSLTAPVVASSALRDAEILLTGEGACPGVGQGTLVASSGVAEDRNAKGEDVVLGSAITSPEDIHGMIISKALVTESGGSTSHAAVVGRSLGIPTVVKCGEGKVVELQDEEVTVDGSNGIVYRGLLPLNYPETESNYLAELSSWLDELCPLDVFSLSDSIPNEVLDLDVVDGGNDAEMLPALLQEATYARGSILDSTAGIAAAVRSSIKGIVVPHPLSARLAAIKVNLMK